MRSAILVAVFALTFAAPALAAPGTHHAAPIRITVTAKEFLYKFSRTSVPHGSTVIFTVENKGQLAHNLVFQTLNKQTRLLSPGQHVTLTVKFPKKGHYYYLCSVPNHAEEGMAGSFVVT